MLRSLVKMLGKHVLCGAAVLTAASLGQAQGTLPPLEPPPLVPAPVPAVPKNQPITQVQVKDGPGAQLGVPAEPATPHFAVPPSSNNDDKARIERLEKQIQELTNAMKATQAAQARPVPVASPVDAGQQGLTAKDVQQLINGYFADKEATEKAAVAAERAGGYKVGTDLSMKVSWKDGVWFETKNRDFYFHVGGEMQVDSLFWGSPNSPVTAAKGAAAKTPGYSTGDSKGGIGELVDSSDFRRLRLWAEGGFWEVGEFMFQPKFEKFQNGQAGLDEMWVGVKDIPWLGTIRVGHHKTPQGLESDDYSSNRTFTYMERSTMSNAFFQNFGTGIIFTNNIAKDLIGERATYATMFYKPQDGENGAQYADGDYAFTGRFSVLPIYQNEGRHLLHLAFSATYRHNRNGNATVSAQPEMFSFNGGDNGYGAATAAGGANVSNMNAPVNGVLAGNASPNGANNAALVSTGVITSTAQTVFGSELLYIRGPFSVQAEYAALSFIDTLGAGGHAGSTGNLTVHGGYVALSYVLTGENRTYDTRLGRLGTNYLAPRTPFWLVRDENGRFNSGLGAWELEARFSHLDLNTKDINGGETDAINLGVVWHLNNNLRVTFDYLRQNRYDLPANVNSGWLSGFGIRTQLQF